jgi:excisionase family DNA binding protein
LKIENQTYTVAEAAQILGISRQTGYVLARSGELPGVRKLGGRFIVVKNELEAYLYSSKFKMEVTEIE